MEMQLDKKEEGEMHKSQNSPLTDNLWTEIETWQ
jgi:hypothetical protein